MSLPSAMIRTLYRARLFKETAPGRPTVRFPFPKTRQSFATIEQTEPGAKFEPGEPTRDASGGDQIKSGKDIA